MAANKRDPKGDSRTNAGKSYGGKYGRGSAGVLGKPVSWAEVDSIVLQDCIAAVAGCGDAILFSNSADGGVLSLRVYHGRDSTPFYFKDAETAEAGLAEIRDLAGGEVAT